MDVDVTSCIELASYFKLSSSFFWPPRSAMNLASLSSKARFLIIITVSVQ